MALGLRNLRRQVPGVVVQLKGTDRTRYAEADERGRFVFDGLPQGKYTVSGFAAGYPAQKLPVTAPKEIQLEKKSCSLEVLIATKPAAR